MPPFINDHLVPGVGLGPNGIVHELILPQGVFWASTLRMIDMTVCAAAERISSSSVCDILFAVNGVPM